MGRRNKGVRILGPYETRGRWRVFEVDASNARTAVYFASRQEAVAHVELFEEADLLDDHDTDSARKLYLKHLASEGNRKSSMDRTDWSIKTFFPSAKPLWGIRPKHCAKLYESMCTTPRKKTGKPLAVDSHRNALAEVKTFLDWCVGQGWIRRNPAAEVKGVGARSHGKPQLERIKDVRKWYAAAIDLAEGGDEGATAALMALILGMRATEIVTRKLSDLDEDEAPCDVVIIKRGKTTRSRRRIEVPDPLRGYLVELSEARGDDAYLFEAKSATGHHERGWVIDNVKRICRAAKVDVVTAHAMRGALATIATSSGAAAHIVTATLGHSSIKTTQESYAAAGSVDVGVRRRGHLKLVNGGE
jgi:integrase